MDATVNNFLKEINQLAPEKSHSEVPEWQECVDKLTGYTYYWNTVTDEVTWTAPKSFSPDNGRKGSLKLNPKKPISLEKPNLNVNKDIKPENKVKIYSLQETFQAKLKEENEMSKKTFKKPKFDDSDIEKIELITEYSVSSDSEVEEKTVEYGKKEISIPENEDFNSDEDDDVDLLVKIQQKAQELKKLGGEVPAEVKNIFRIKPTPSQEVNSVSGIALVAGYNSDSDTEVEKSNGITNENPTTENKNNVAEVSHSTLFPITQPINVNDFISSNSELTESTTFAEISSENFDSKAFKRKKRIGVSLINNIKKIKSDTLSENEHQGLGYKAEETNESQGSPKDIYSTFQKGGVLFVKPEENESNKPSVLKDDSSLDESLIVKTYDMLREKLTFLGEGKTPVLPVQVMLIQAETLFLAMERKGIQLSYLYKWLEETCAELSKLEREAAPEGWLLQWDRSHKRYFYLNKVTGESQWDYPQPDITRCDEAMDISTTPPPPPEECEHIESNLPQSSVFGPHLPVDPPSPPSPPRIRVPTPPPPPLIRLEHKTEAFAMIPLPTKNSKAVGNIDEPLPPGVDTLEASCASNSKGANSGDALNSVLDSFYSEIAVSEKFNSKSEPLEHSVGKTNSEEIEQNSDKDIMGEQIKKKKKKVKLAPGLTMKKKGVSQLVEKWKNVQKSYGD